MSDPHPNEHGGPRPGDGPSRRRILIASAAALMTAVVVLLVAVLPAEYGIDPLGTGQLLGLLALSQERPIAARDVEYRVDSTELQLLPGEWLEYKYYLEAGASMVYSWQSSAVLSYDFHGQPDGAAGRFAESFDIGDSDQGHGSYAAPFAGIHGWYWENKGTTQVTINLSSAGFYGHAYEGRDRVNGTHEVSDLRGNKVPLE